MSSNFYQWFSARRLPIYMWKTPPTSCVPSTLIKFKINVEIFETCPYFLDGHLSYLTTLIIHAKRISYSFSETDSSLSVISIIVFSRKTVILNRQTFFILFSL
jgi:hypothetical protein